MKTKSLKSILLISFIALFISSCQLGQNPPQSTAADVPGMHKGVVTEVIHTTMYTYLHVEEKSADKWLALPKMEASAGETYYYTDGMEMKNFESRELGRTFETVYFLETISKTPHPETSKEMAYPASGTGKPKAEKKAITVEPAAGGISISTLYQNKSSYANQKVKIRGEVVKFNSAIMGKNWVHIQDGSEFEGKFDLTATTDTEVSVGDVVTLEGVILLDKDFGYGYSYEILMEDASVSKEL